jgi:hypothetical protein
MNSVGMDMGAMWRLSEDLNAARRFAAFKQQHHHHHNHSNHYPLQHSHRPAAVPVFYNGIPTFWLTRIRIMILFLSLQLLFGLPTQTFRKLKANEVIHCKVYKILK